MGGHTARPYSELFESLQILILLTRREARASLTYTGRKLPVPHDPRIRIIPSQLAQQGNERNFLIDGAGIRRAAAGNDKLWQMMN